MVSSWYTVNGFHVIIPQNLFINAKNRQEKSNITNLAACDNPSLRLYIDSLEFEIFE